MSASQLPLFGISGSGHGPGVVPDPGATAGATRYLREDGTWSVPAGAGGLSVGAGSGGAAPIAGAAVDYNFLQGSGTVVTDNSGNSNNGTLGSGALAPTWTPQGLSFTGQNQVALPSSLNSMETFVFGVYLQPISTSVPTNGFPMLLGSSLPNSGLDLLYDYATDGGALAQNTYITSPSIYGSGLGLFTNTKNLVSGFHVLTFVLGVSGVAPDHIYIDGVTATVGGFDSSSAGLQTSGNLFLGSSNTASSMRRASMARCTDLPLSLVEA